MLRSLTMLLPLLLHLFLSAAFADTYTWTDEQGTVHFTEDPGQIPKKLRGKVRKLDEDIPAPAAAPSPPAPDAGTPPAKESEQPATYGGRSYGDWAKELAEREAAMKDVRSRTDEIRELLKHPGLTQDEASKLVDEYQQLSLRFQQLKAEYHQWVENARKACLTVTIQE